LTEENENWALWARKKADWYDPIISRKDEYLNEEDRKNLASEKKTSSFYLDYKK
jgi:hypothetical protein